MKRIAVLLAMLFSAVLANAQYIYKAVVKDANTNETLAGATIKVLGTALGTSTDKSGAAVISGIPQGTQIIQFSYVGFETRTDTMVFPLTLDTPAVILLQAAEEESELEEVQVSATRSTRTIANIPTRIEVIAGEELDVCCHPFEK